MRTLLLLPALVSYGLREWAAKMGVLALLASLLYFGLLTAPGGPLWSVLSFGADCRRIRLSDEQFELMGGFLRLDHPLPVGLGFWLVGEDWLDEVGQAEMQHHSCQENPRRCRQGMLRQDFGTSWSVAPTVPVMRVMEQRQGTTLLLLGSAILFSLLVAVPIGLFFAIRPTSGLSFALFNFTIPVGWLSLLLIATFSGNQSPWHQWLGLPFLPTGSSLLLRGAPPEGSLLALLAAGQDIRGSWLDTGIHLILPMLALSATPMIQWSRALHGALGAALGEEVLRTAPGKGLLARVALYRAALHRTLPTLLCEVHRSLPALVGALLIVEVTFNWQGMGQLYVRAMGANDFPVAIGFLLLTAEWLLMTSLLKETTLFFLSRQKAVSLA